MVSPNAEGELPEPTESHRPSPPTDQADTVTVIRQTVLALPANQRREPGLLLQAMPRGTVAGLEHKIEVF